MLYPSSLIHPVIWFVTGLKKKNKLSLFSLARVAKFPFDVLFSSIFDYTWNLNDLVVIKFWFHSHLSEVPNVSGNREYVMELVCVCFFFQLHQFPKAKSEPTILISVIFNQSS